jgi:hypothetical protein
LAEAIMDFKNVSALDPTKMAFSLLQEFKNFAPKGNVIDLAVGVVETVHEPYFGLSPCFGASGILCVLLSGAGGTGSCRTRSVGLAAGVRKSTVTRPPAWTGTLRSCTTSWPWSSFQTARTSYW